MLLAFVSCDKNDDDNNHSLNSSDQNFLTTAAYSSHDEVEFAQLALAKSTDDSVKMFAQMMITDHTKALMGLDSLAGQYNVNLPTTIDSAHAALKTTLMSLSGIDFDTTYAAGQVKDHMAAVALFQNQANGGDNDKVRDFAARNLPVLQMHLQMADSLTSYLH